MVCITSEHYQGGMKHKYRVRQCSKSNPDQTQYQEEKIIYIAAEEIVWDYSPSRKWEKELKSLQRKKYGGDLSLYLGRLYSVVLNAFLPPPPLCLCLPVSVSDSLSGSGSPVPHPISSRLSGAASVRAGPHLELRTECEEDAGFLVPQQHQAGVRVHNQVDAHLADGEGRRLPGVRLNHLHFAVAQLQLVALPGWGR